MSKGFAHLLLLLVLLVGLAGGVYLVQQKTNLFSRAFQSGESVDELTLELTTLNNQIGRSAQGDKTAQMLALAQKRQEILLKEAKENPEAFLAHARLAETNANFPSEVQSLIEKKVRFDGEWRTRHSDNFDTKTSKSDFSLTTSGKSYQVYFKDGDPHRVFPKQVSVSGVSLDTVIVLNYPNQISSRSAQDFTPPKNLKLGVILFKFSSTGANPFTKESVDEKVFSGSKSVKKYYEEVSLNQISVSGQVFDWVTIDSNPKDNCEIIDWENQALEKLKDKGIDLSTFSHNAFVHPNVNACFYAGSASMGGNEFDVNGDMPSSVFAHELGHNLGMDHANELDCHQKPIDLYASCSEYEYGDGYDAMGFFIHHLNAPHKASLGWIPEEKIQTVTGDGVYKISVLEKPANSSIPQTLRIQRSNINDDYYLEYRQPIGFDSDLPTTLTQGALIHIGNEERIGFTKILRVSPEKDYDTSHALSDGQGFLDPVNGISIQQIAHDSDSVTVSVRFTTPILSDSALLSGWRKTTNPPTNQYFDQLITANGWIFGLQNYGSSYYKAKIRSDGSLGQWGVSNSFNTFTNIKAASSGEYIYFTSSSLPSPTQPGAKSGDISVQVTITPTTPNSLQPVKYAHVNGSGEVESWKDAPSLPGDWVQTFDVIDNFVVVGVNQKFYLAKINPDGSLGEWVKGPDFPDNNIYNFDVTGGDNHIYILANQFQIDGSVKTQLFSTTLVSPPTGNFSWSQITMPANLIRPTMIYSSGYLMLMGGYDIYYQKMTSSRSATGGGDPPPITPNITSVAGNSTGWQKLNETPLPRSFDNITGVIWDNKLIISGVNYRTRPGSTILYSTLKLASTPSTPVASCQDECYSDQLWVGITKTGDVCDSLHPKNVYKCGGTDGLPKDTVRICKNQSYTCNGNFWSK